MVDALRVVEDGRLKCANGQTRVLVAPERSEATTWSKRRLGGCSPGPPCALRLDRQIEGLIQLDVDRNFSYITSS